MPCVWSWVWCASSLLLVLLSCLCSLKNFLQLVLNTFLDSAIVVITGGIPGKTEVPMGGKRTWRINHSGDGFRERCLLYCMWATTSTVEAYGLRLGSTLPWIAHSKHSSQQGLYVEETQKGGRECVDTPAEHLPATHAPSEFRVLTSGDIREHGVPWLKSTVCQVSWLPGHTCIFIYRILIS